MIVSRGLGCSPGPEKPELQAERSLDHKASTEKLPISPPFSSAVCPAEGSNPPPPSTRQVPDVEPRHAIPAKEADDGAGRGSGDSTTLLDVDQLVRVMVDGIVTLFHEHEADPPASKRP